MRVNAEKRLWAAILLQAIAEQDAALVILPTSISDRQRQKIAAEAKEWVESGAFDEACEIAGFDAFRFRTLTSREALEARARLLLGEYLKEEKDVEEFWEEGS